MRAMLPTMSQACRRLNNRFSDRETETAGLRLRLFCCGIDLGQRQTGLGAQQGANNKQKNEQEWGVGR